MGRNDYGGTVRIPASRREKRSSKRLDRFKEAIAKGEEPGKFYHNISKAGLFISVIVMMAVWMWLLFQFQDTPEILMPLMIWGIVSLSYSGALVGLLEYWLYEKESTHIALGHLKPMPFLRGEWKATVKIPYQTKAGEKLTEKWEVGRVGKTNWMWTHGGGKKGYYACKILQRVHIDDSHNPPTLVKEDADSAGYWEGSTYRVPMDFSLTYADRLKEEIVRTLKGDMRFKENESRIYAAELPLPEKFRGMEAVSDMVIKLHDRNEEIAMLRAKIRRMNIDESIRRSTEPEITQKTVVYKGASPEE
jgi:hypothetical protein